MSLSESEDRDPYHTVGLLGTLRWKGMHSAEELAKKLQFNSAEEMHNQLEDWDVPDWLIGVETNSGKGKARGKGTPPRLRSLGPGKDLPPFGNATDLIKQHLEALLKMAELRKQMDESLHGRQFVRQDAEPATVLFSREIMSKEGWEAACEQHGLDPDGKDEEIWDINAQAILPGGVALSPTEDETILIAVYALAGGDMDALLDLLHPDSPCVKAETRERVRLWVEGAKADGDTRDGLKVLAQQLGTWVRGGEVRPGKPSGLSKADHAFACGITHYRNQGLIDEEILDKESHRKKADGTSYSLEDVAKLGDLGLTWS
jgi:hypothetical protein